MATCRYYYAGLGIGCVLLVLRGIDSQDDTLKPRAVGLAVVETVCSRLEASCVFEDDKLFLRRLAYVESRDGLDRKTFRTAYYGGIWQVTHYMMCYNYVVEHMLNIS